MTPETPKANIIKANYRLQQKVSAGPLDERTVKASQSVIDNNQVEFESIGLSILHRLKIALDEATGTAEPAQLKDILIPPVMELKANAAIFHYKLIGDLANIMLAFLESIETVDKDAYEIVAAHHSTLQIILTRKLTGDGGEAGRKLTNELQAACNRYRQKKLLR